MKEINGARSRKYLAEEVGKGNGLTHFEDFANHFYKELDDIEDNIEYSTYREAGECLAYLKYESVKHNSYDANRKFIEHWDRG